MVKSQVQLPGGNQTTPRLPFCIYTGVTVESAKGKCVSCKVCSRDQWSHCCSNNCIVLGNEHRAGLRHFPNHQSQLLYICLLIFYTLSYFHLLIISWQFLSSTEFPIYQIFWEMSISGWLRMTWPRRFLGGAGLGCKRPAVDQAEINPISAVGFECLHLLF